MKTLLNVVSWISGSIAAILILIGLIAFLFKCSLLGVNHAIYFFVVANSFFLLSICCLIDRKISDDKEK
jgi:hypothetical protein